MSTDTTQRSEALQQAPQEITDLYGDIDLGGNILTYSEALCFSDAREFTFIHIIGDIILGLIPQTDFIPSVIRDLEITKEKAEEMYRTFEPFFKKAERARAGASNIPEANNTLKEKLELRPDNPQIPTTVTRPLTRDEVLSALAPKRTMQGDIARIQNNENPNTK